MNAVLGLKELNRNQNDDGCFGMFFDLQNSKQIGVFPVIGIFPKYTHFHSSDERVTKCQFGHFELLIVQSKDFNLTSVSKLCIMLKVRW